MQVMGGGQEGDRSVRSGVRRGRRRQRSVPSTAGPVSFSTTSPLPAGHSAGGVSSAAAGGGAQAAWADAAGEAGEEGGRKDRICR